MAHSYRHAHFSRLRAALQSSLRTSIRIAQSGLLSVQVMMHKGTGGESAAGGASGPAAATGAKGGAATGTKTGAGTDTKPPAPGQGHGFLEFLIAPLDEELDSGLLGGGGGGGHVDAGAGYGYGYGAGGAGQGKRRRGVGSESGSESDGSGEEGDTSTSRVGRRVDYSDSD